MRFFLLIIFLSTFLFSKKLEKVSIQFKWMHSFQFAGYYAALEKGFYKDLGLDVTLKEKTLGGKSYIDRVLDGNSQYGVADTSIINHAIRNKDRIIWLAQIFQHSPMVLMTLKDSGITSPYELKGKKLSSNTLNVVNVTIQAMLYNAIKSPKKNMHFVKKTYHYKSLVDKTIDAFSGYITDQAYMFKKDGIDINIIDPRSYGIDFYGDNLFTSKEELQNHPLRVQKFREASLKGWEYALDNPKEIIELILEKYNTQNMTKQHLEYEAKMTDRMIVKELIPLGTIEKNRVQRIIETYYQNGTINTLELPENLIYKNNNLELTKEEYEWLKEKETINFAAPFDASPMITQGENNNTIGIVPDYFKRVSKLLNKKINIIPYMNKQDNKFHKYIYEKNIDAIATVTKNKETKEFYIFTEPYISSDLTFFTNKKYKDKINSIEDLKDKSVAIQEGHHALKNFLKGKVKSFKIYKTQKEVLEAVQYEKADLVIGYTGLHHLINKYFFDNIFFSFSAKKDIQIRVGVKKTHPILVSILNKAFKKIDLEQKERLIKRWLNTNNDFRENQLFSFKQIEYLKDLQKIRLCIYQDKLPYEKLLKDGQYLGLVADYMKLFSEKTNTPFEYIRTNNEKQSLQYLKDDKCNILANYDITQKKQTSFYTSKNYFSSPIVFALRDNEAMINDFSQILDKKYKIAVINNSSLIKFLKELYPDIKIIKVSSSKEGLKKLLSKEVDTLVDILGSLSYNLQKQNLLGIKIAGIVPKEMNFNLLINKEYFQLLNILNKSIDNIDTKEKNEINKKWFEIKFEKTIDYTLLWQITLVFIIILILFIYRSALIQRANKKLKAQKEEIKKKNIQLEEQYIQLKNTQEKLQNKEKMALLGEMLGNIAHQWRQPLNLISSVASGMKFKKEFQNLSDKEFNEHIALILKNSMYLSETINDFKNLTTQYNNASRFNLAQNLNKTLELIIRSLIEHKIEIIRNIDEKLEIYSYPNILTQILINIILNAKDALSDRNNKLIFISIKKENTKILIEIKDNAGGIPDKIKDKIFEPYFTTKHQSQGTGLGLSMVYSMLHNNLNASIEVKNERFKYKEKEQKGASFKIYLQDVEEK